MVRGYIKLYIDFLSRKNSIYEENKEISEKVSLRYPKYFSTIPKFASPQDCSTAIPHNRNLLSALFRVFQRSHHIQLKGVRLYQKIMGRS